jgi:diguanylate cyclase (GGDEF)-like protein/PAS domain S-box-containing protein
VAAQEHLDADAIESALLSLLETYPYASVAAVAWNGMFCAMPDSIPLTTHVLSSYEKGIDLVPPEDRRTMLEQFNQAKELGASSAHVHDRDGRAATAYVLDTRERHGALILLFTVDEEAPAPAPGGRAASAVTLPGHEPFPSKFGRVRRNDVAVILAVDDGICQLTGLAPEELIGREPSALIHPDDHDMALNNWFEVIVAPPYVARRGRARHLRSDGSWVWLEFTNYNRLNDPEHGDILCEMMDISQEMQAVDELHEGRELLRRLTEALPLGILQIDGDRRVVYTNRRLHQIVGVDARPTLDDQLGTVIHDDRQELERAVETVMTVDSDLTVELRVLLPRSHRPRICQVVLRTLGGRARDISGAILCVSDVTESAMMRRELENRATFDQLTRCHNRAAIMTELERVLHRARQQDEGFGVVFVDIDRFKPVNDRLGHAAGDELLAIVARRLREAVRAQDLVGRIGGDEFLVLCPETRHREVAEQIGERIAEHVNGTVRLGEQTVAVTVSIGVVWAHGGQLRVDELVALADRAMYRSKRRRLSEAVVLTEADWFASPVGDEPAV